MFTEYKEKIDAFIKDRDWEINHHIKNLAICHIVETLELLECFKKGQVEDNAEINGEIGDCFMTLFCLYRNLNFDIEKHIASTNIEAEAYKEHPHSKEELAKELSIRSAFLLEAFTWTTEEESRAYTNTLPDKTLVLPFKLLLALCHLQNQYAIDLMNQKLIINAAKYSVEKLKDPEEFDRIRNSKIQKRGT